MLKPYVKAFNSYKFKKTLLVKKYLIPFIFKITIQHVTLILKEKALEIIAWKTNEWIPDVEKNMNEVDNNVKNVLFLER